MTGRSNLQKFHIGIAPLTCTVEPLTLGRRMPTTTQTSFMQNRKTPRAGFTLIELLTVIAIIGVLAAILIPTVGAVRKQAAKVSSANNVKQIAISFSTFSNSGTRPRVITKGAWSTQNNRSANDMKDWAMVLAYHAEMTDANVWFISSDEDVVLYGGTLPRTIGTRGTGSTFNQSTEWNAISEREISYNAVSGMSPNAPASTTPLIWTKGLGSNGYWEATSPWQGEGGHIGFMDGHVEFFPNIADDEYRLAPGSASGQRSTTNNIRDAIETTTQSDVVRNLG